MNFPKSIPCCQGRCSGVAFVEYDRNFSMNVWIFTCRSCHSKHIDTRSFKSGVETWYKWADLRGLVIVLKEKKLK
jgi:hypothetical protein